MKIMEKLTLEKLQSIWESNALFDNIDIVVILSFNSTIKLGTLSYYQQLNKVKSFIIAEGEIELLDSNDDCYVLCVGEQKFIIQHYIPFIDKPSFNMTIPKIGTLQFTRSRSKLK